MKFSRLFVLGLVALAVSLASCSGKDGEDGDPGIAGETGINCWDTNGDGINDANEDVNGDNEFNGLDCQGAAGTDGNANAMHYFVQIPDDPSGKSSFSINVPQLTQEVLDEDTILFYFQKSEGENFVYTFVPGLGRDGNYIVGVKLDVGTATFIVKDFNGVDLPIPENEVSGIKMIIIESSSTTTIQGKGQQQLDVLGYLESEGVEIADYHDVLDYFNLKSE